MFYVTLIMMLSLLNIFKLLDMLSTTFQVKGFMYNPKIKFHQKMIQMD